MKAKANAQSVVAKPAQTSEQVRKAVVGRFNFDNCPESYEQLKSEARFLAGMENYAFLLMAQRLFKIHSEKLYANEYKDFQSFLQKEIPFSIRSAYNWIDLLRAFGVETLRLQALADDDIKYSKLIPLLPILKSDKKEIPKDDLKKRFLREIKTKSFREIYAEARELKLKYGLAKKENGDTTKQIGKLFGVIEKKRNLSEREKEKWIELAEMVNAKLNIGN